MSEHDNLELAAFAERRRLTLRSYVLSQVAKATQAAHGADDEWQAALVAHFGKRAVDERYSYDRSRHTPRLLELEKAKLEADRAMKAAAALLNFGRSQVISFVAFLDCREVGECDLKRLPVLDFVSRFAVLMVFRRFHHRHQRL